MRELTDQEMQDSAGGILPVIGFAASLAGHAAGFSGVATWAVSSVGLITSTIGLADYLHNS